MAQGWCPAGWLRVVSPRLAPHIRDKTPQNLRRMQRRTTWSQAPRILVGKGGGRPRPRWGQDGGHARPSWIFGNSGSCRRGLQLSCVQRARSPPAPGGKALSLRDEIQPQTGGTWPGWPLGPSRGTRAQRRKGALSPFQRRGRLRPMGQLLGAAEGGSPWGATSPRRADTGRNGRVAALQSWPHAEPCGQRPGKNIDQSPGHISCSERSCKTREKIDLSGG